MPPPHEAKFTNKEDMKDYLCDWAKSQGAVFSIRCSEKDRRFPHVFDKGGSYHSQ
jgi:hypothetical protein